MTPAIKWLLIEGLTPLLGAAALFLVWGACRYVAAQDKTNFKHDWWAALDPIGWLYGGAVLASQAGVRSYATDNNALTIACFGGATICLLVLIAAMTERAANVSWQPPRTLKWSVIVLVVGILYAGYSVSEAAVEAAKQAPPTGQGGSK